MMIKNHVNDRSSSVRTNAAENHNKCDFEIRGGCKSLEHAVHYQHENVEVEDER